MRTKAQHTMDFNSIISASISLNNTFQCSKLQRLVYFIVMYTKAFCPSFPNSVSHEGSCHTGTLNEIYKIVGKPWTFNL